jgi:cell pole-organizing protein PopZ
MTERDSINADDKGILDTVRRILNEDQVRAVEPPFPQRPPSPRPAQHDDILRLEPDMIIDDHAPDQASSGAQDQNIVGARTETTTRQSLGSLRSAIREQKSLLTHRNGPSIEDVIREEMRPLLREWLDANLPKLVEQTVRSEIARIVEREGG